MDGTWRDSFDYSNYRFRDGTPKADYRLAGPAVSYRPITKPVSGSISLPPGVTLDERTGEALGGNECGSWQGSWRDSFTADDAFRATVNKETHRIRFENETEKEVTIVIEEKPQVQIPQRGGDEQC